MQIAVIIAVSIIFYIRTLRYGLVSDDTDAYTRGGGAIKKSIEENKKDPKKPILKVPLWRQLASELSCRNIYNIRRCHFLSIFFHTLNCVLIYVVFGKDTVSFLAALLFCLNPATNQGAVWMSGRGYSITTTIILLMWWARDVILLSSFLYYLGFTWGFNIVFSPVIFLLTDRWYLIFSIPVVALLSYQRGRSFTERIQEKAKTSTNTMKSIHPRKLPLFFKAFWYYLRFCLFPLRLGMYHDHLYSWGVSKYDNEQWLKIDWRFWVGIPVFFGYMVLMFYNLKNPIGFGMFWWLINMAMWCHYPFTIQQAVGERYTYLPNVGLMYALSYFILEVVK